MKWIGISGTWKTVSTQVAQDVRSEVAAIMQAGNGIVSGGALGVDYIATDEALRHDPTASRIKVILPTSLQTYELHYFKRAEEGVISREQAEQLITQLKTLQAINPASLTEMFYTACNQESYYNRNSAVLGASDMLIAFQVNNSSGTQDTIDKALEAGKPVIHKKYSL